MWGDQFLGGKARGHGAVGMDGFGVTSAFTMGLMRGTFLCSHCEGWKTSTIPESSYVATPKRQHLNERGTIERPDPLC